MAMFHQVLEELAVPMRQLERFMAQVQETPSAARATTREGPPAQQEAEWGGTPASMT